MEKTKLNKASFGIILGLTLLLLGVFVFAFLNKDTGGGPWAYLMYAIAGLIFIFLIVYLILLKQGKIKQREPDYYTFFIMGIIWLPAGIAADIPGLWMLGLVFLIIGAANKDKWKKQPKFSELPKAQRNLKISALILGILFFTGFVFYALYR